MTINGLGRPDASEMFKKLDSDGDKKVSKDELRAGMKNHPPPPGGAKGPKGAKGTDEASSLDDLFAKIDEDGDGSISESENESFMKQMETKRHDNLQKAQSGDEDTVKALLEQLTQTTGYGKSGDLQSSMQSLLNVVA